MDKELSTIQAKEIPRFEDNDIDKLGRIKEAGMFAGKDFMPICKKTHDTFRPILNELGKLMKAEKWHTNITGGVEDNEWELSMIFYLSKTVNNKIYSIFLGVWITGENRTLCCLSSDYLIGRKHKRVRIHGNFESGSVKNTIRLLKGIKQKLTH